MSGNNIAIIGGTGFESLPPEIYADEIVVETRFGNVTVLSVSYNYVEPYKLYFLPRHGSDHSLAPHQINYRGNIAALQQLEVDSIFASNAVGSLRTDLLPGQFALLTDFIDYTRARPLSFFGEGEVWKHTDFSIPYSDELRKAIMQAAENSGISLLQQATYLCCDGPRFESPAEVRLFGSWGADVVGMTGLPEAIFAREAGIQYAALAIVTNLGAGLTSEPVDHNEVSRLMREKLPEVRELLLAAAAQLVESRVIKRDSTSSLSPSPILLDSSQGRGDDTVDNLSPCRETKRPKMGFANPARGFRGRESNANIVQNSQLHLTPTPLPSVRSSLGEEQMQDTVTPAPLRAIEQPGRGGRGVRCNCFTFTVPLTPASNWH